MQAFRRATVVFCMACIGAELVALLAGSARAARCIKAAAGLYILAVLFSLLPAAPAALRTLRVPEMAPVSMPVQEPAEQQILARAADQLEQACEEQCLQRFGAKVQIALTLETDGQKAAVTQAVAAFAAECDRSQKQEVLAYLQQELGIAPREAEATIP